MKKDHIFKRLPAFAAGMLAVAMLAALAEPVSAAGAKIAYNQVGIRVIREQQVKAGQTYTAPSGQQIPFTITYTDAAGIQTNYIAAAQLSKLLDADISWDEETSSIEIGVPPVPGEVTITVENRSNDGPPAPTPSNEPEYGLVIGNLEEIDPHTVGDVITADPGSYYIRSTRMQSPDGSFPEITAHPRPASKGESYLVYSVTNNGETPQGHHGYAAGLHRQPAGDVPHSSRAARRDAGTGIPNSKRRGDPSHAADLFLRRRQQRHRPDNPPAGAAGLRCNRFTVKYQSGLIPPVS